MSFSANRLIVAGNLTRDPELRQISPERVVVNFTLAINQRSRGSDGEVKESVIFLDCEAWGRTAELVQQYLVKGSGAYIEGRLKQDAWQDKDGQKRSKIRAVAEIVRFTGTPRHAGAANDGANASDGAGGGETPGDEPGAGPGDPLAASQAGAAPATRPASVIPRAPARPTPRNRGPAPLPVGGGPLIDEEPPF